MRKRDELLEEITLWARRYPELYEVGDARNTIANRLATLFNELDSLEDHVHHVYKRGEEPQDMNTDPE